jgi:hypothetical protein
VFLGLYPAPLLDGLHYNASNLIINYDYTEINAEIYKYIADNVINEAFDKFDYSKGQVNYIDLPEPLYNIIETNYLN